MKDRIARLRTKVRTDKGFTLVELLVTVTIIGILAAVVTVGVSGVASSSQTKANQALFQGYQSLIDAWLASNPLQDPDKDVPVLASRFSCSGDTSCTATGTTGATFKWFTADGVAANDRSFKDAIGTAYATSATYAGINPASTAKDGTQGQPPKTEFSKFFRLGNASSAVCVVNTASTSNVLACKN